MAITTRMTAEDLWALPEDQRGELIRGEMTPVTPVGNPHWKIVAKVIYALEHFVREHRLGDVGAAGGFLLERDPDVVLAPDAAFVRAGRLSDDQTGFMPLAPDLAVEVISPSNSAPEMSRRVLKEKLAHIRDTGADILATGNPGCQMQIGAGALLTGLKLQVCHPIELLDKAYKNAGVYGPQMNTDNTDQG